MKRLLPLLLLVIACSDQTAPGVTSIDGEWVSVGGNTWYREVPLPNGRVVPCLVWQGYSNSAGMSCDWSDR